MLLTRYVLKKYTVYYKFFKCSQSVQKYYQNSILGIIARFRCLDRHTVARSCNFKSKQLNFYLILKIFRVKNCGNPPIQMKKTKKYCLIIYQQN